MSLQFLVTALIVVLAPGTGVIYTVSTGLSHGRSASIAAAVGCTLGILPPMTAAILGLATMLHASVFFFQMFKALGVAYLIYMAWSISREKGALEIDPQHELQPLGRIAVRGILINILNPKLSIFFLAFLPQFVPVDAAHPLLLMTGMSLIFMMMTFIVFSGYGAFASAVRYRVVSSPVVMSCLRWGFAAAFVALGFSLVFERP